MILQTMATAPTDREILVWYDHAADPYFAGDGKLTDYGAHCESGNFLPDKGFAIAKWVGQEWETTDEYGGGFWIPSGWFAKEHACNPIYWAELPDFPETRK